MMTDKERLDFLEQFCIGLTLLEEDCSTYKAILDCRTFKLRYQIDDLIERVKLGELKIKALAKLTEYERELLGF